MELHGRVNSVVPWSVRHMAVYHKFNSRKNCSVWILLQASQHTRNQLVDHILRQDYAVKKNTPAGTDDPFLCHMLLLMPTSENWRWYINYLEDELESLVGH